MLTITCMIYTISEKSDIWNISTRLIIFKLYQIHCFAKSTRWVINVYLCCCINCTLISMYLFIVNKGWKHKINFRPITQYYIQIPRHASTWYIPSYIHCEEDTLVLMWWKLETFPFAWPELHHNEMRTDFSEWEWERQRGRRAGPKPSFPQPLRVNVCDLSTR